MIHYLRSCTTGDSTVACCLLTGVVLLDLKCSLVMVFLQFDVIISMSCGHEVALCFFPIDSKSLSTNCGSTFNIRNQNNNYNTFTDYLRPLPKLYTVSTRFFILYTSSRNTQILNTTYHVCLLFDSNTKRLIHVDRGLQSKIEQAYNEKDILLISTSIAYLGAILIIRFADPPFFTPPTLDPPAMPLTDEPLRPVFSSVDKAGRLTVYSLQRHKYKYYISDLTSKSSVIPPGTPHRPVRK